MALVKKEAYFNSSNGFNKIRTLIWEDDELTPVGIVQLTHGMAEHIARYDEFARFLASNGFVVCGNDHLGHGKSVSSPDDLGFTAEEDGFRRFVDDMHILTKIMKKRNPDIPYFLFGHSMGSFCARIYAVHFGYELDGVILCGCHPGDCHYSTGNYFARRRMTLLFSQLDFLGIEKGRTRVEWCSAAEGVKFAGIMNEFVEQIKSLGECKKLEDVRCKM